MASNPEANEELIRKEQEISNEIRKHTEELVDKKWESAIEKGLDKFAIGTAVGLIGFLLLWKRPTFRGISLGLGMGVPLGYSWSETKTLPGFKLEHRE